MMPKSKKQPEYVTQDEFHEAMNMVMSAFGKVATKDELKNTAEELKRHVSASLEIILDEFKGVFRDDMTAVKEKQQDHEERLVRVEEKVL